MKKILSLVLVFAVCLTLIATPAFAQITYENPAQPESAPAEPVDGEAEVSDAPVTEAEIANARMTFNSIANFIAEFNAGEAYTGLSEIVNFGDSFTFWKEDMTADIKNLIFGELKSNLSALDSGSFLEDTIRTEMANEESKAAMASAGVKQISENAFDLMGIMTMTVEGNSYIYTDATGKVIQKVSISTAPDPDSVYITVEVADGDKMVETKLLAHLGDDVITVSGTEEGSTEFEPVVEIAFPETNVITTTDLKKNETVKVTFVPEDYLINVLTPETTNETTGDKVPAQEISVEVNPENKSIGITVDAEEILAVYFYPEEKEVTLVSPMMAEATASLGGSGDSVTLKFDDAAKTLNVVSGENPLANLLFNEETSSIDISVSAGEMGMMSGISLAVDAAANNIVFTFMGIEMFNATLDPAAETITIASADMMTQSTTTDTLTIEDFAKMLRPQTIIQTEIEE